MVDLIESLVDVVEAPVHMAPEAST
jgi:hypothetical protein